MFQKIKTSTGLIIIFAFSVIVFGGAYTYASLTAPSYGYADLSVSTKTNDETSDWTTYESKINDFSFKYPKEWTSPPVEATTEESMGALSKDLIYKVAITDPESKILIDCANNEFQSWSAKTPTKTTCTPILAGLTESEKSNYRGPRSPKNIYVRVYKNPTNIELNTWLTSTFKLANSELSDYEVGTAIEMAGVNGYKSSIGCCAGVDNNYVIAKDGYIYSLGTNYYETSSTEKTMPDYFLNIVKTFKLLTPDQITSDWKTYENKDLGFSLKYPSDWKTVKLNVINNSIAEGNYGGNSLSSSDGKNGLVYFDPDKVFDISSYASSYKSYGPSMLNKTQINPNWTAEQIVTNMSLESGRVLLAKKLNDVSILLIQSLNYECSPSLSVSVVTPLNNQFPNLEIAISAVNNETDQTVQSYLTKIKTDASKDPCDLSIPYSSITEKINSSTYSDKLTKQIKIAELIASSLSK